jgi:predicted N-acetyltransferase YhbS
MPDRLDEWTVPELLCYHPVGKHIRQAMLAGQPRRVWHAVLWQEGRPVGNMSVNATDGARGVVGLHDLFVLPSAGVTGLGLDLFDGALGFVSDLGCRYVVTNAGEGAAALFEAGGFRPLGRGATWSLPHHALRLQFEEDQVWLAEAVGEGDIDAMAALVARADDGVLDRPLANGLRPLRFAAAHGRDDSARWLLARGARPDLLAAWDLGWRDEARELLERDATLARTHRSHSGKTLLHVAAERDDPDLATLLLHHGADPAARDGRFDGTPLEWAEELGRLRVAEVLRRAPG